MRCVGVVLAALPLFAGFVPILFDSRRRGFQDWLARTAVVEAPGPSIAEVSRAKKRAIREASRQPPPADAANDRRAHPFRVMTGVADFRMLDLDVLRASGQARIGTAVPGRVDRLKGDIGNGYAGCDWVSGSGDR